MLQHDKRHANRSRVGLEEEAIPVFQFKTVIHAPYYLRARTSGTPINSCDIQAVGGHHYKEKARSGSVK